MDQLLETLIEQGSVIYGPEMLDPLDERTVLFAVGILVFGSAVFALLHFRSPKNPVKHSNYIVVLLTGMLLFLLVGGYASLRPSSPVSIVFSISGSLVLFVLGSYFLAFFSRVDLFVKGFRNFLARLYFLGSISLFLAVMVDLGIVFLLKDLINPATIGLTPEVFSIAVPTTTVIILFVKRFERHTTSEGLKLLRNLSTYVIESAFLLFLLRNVILAAGGNISQSPGLDQALYTSLPVVAIVFGAEGIFVLVRSDLAKRGTIVSIDRFVFEIGKQMFRRDRKQKEIREFFPEPPVTIPEPTRSSRMFTSLEQKLTFKVGRRVVKGGVVIFLLAIVLMGALAFAVLARSTYTVASPGYFVNLSMVNGTQVSASVHQLTSENMDSVSMGTEYAIPIVHVEAGNYSWDAPANQRYLRLNSTDYSVHGTGKYLVFSVHKVTVHIRVSGSRFFPPSADQTGNDQFSYRGTFKDAEIYYALWEFGLHNVTRIFSDSVSGTLETILSDFYASNASGQHVLVESQFKWSSTPVLDTTVVETTIAGFARNVTYLMDQAKVPTSTYTTMGEPASPFQ